MIYNSKMISKNLMIFILVILTSLMSVITLAFSDNTNIYESSINNKKINNEVNDNKISEELNKNSSILNEEKKDTSTSGTVDKEVKKEVASTNNDKPKEVVVPSTNYQTAMQAVEDIKIGWNLGNTFESKLSNNTSYEVSIQKRSGYQFYASYSTKAYSGWDSSSYPYIDSNTGVGSLVWNINKLNSNLSLSPGNFSIQLVNNPLNSSGSNLISYTITEASFKTKNNTIINLTDLIGTHTSTISNNVSSKLVVDLSKYTSLKTTNDLIGGTLTINLKINSYPNPGVITLSKANYFETLWGNPITTSTTINHVSTIGFKAVRIPITYQNHIDQNGNISAYWLQRVKEVVDYVLNNNMYCIINVHHDTGASGWLKADSTYQNNSIKYKNMWRQIANYFNGYGSKLIFEGYNEILDENNKWNYAPVSSYNIANKINQDFVDTVRSTGGNNSNRNLLVNTYAASIEPNVISGFVIPKDTVKDHLIIGVHYYGSSYSAIDSYMNNLNNVFMKKGYPVIIGEFGTTFNQGSEQNRIDIASYYVKSARKFKNTALFWWDDGNYKNEVGAKCNYALYDRVANLWYYKNLASALISSSY